MPNLKQTFIDEIKEEIEELEKEIKESDKEIDILKARIKVEKEMARIEDLPEEIAEDITYSVQALEGMLQMEEDRNLELKKELEITRYRSKAIRKFEDIEL